MLAREKLIEPDAVIAATGYRPGLEPLVGQLDALDERGFPRAVHGEEAAPGLRFIGYVPRPGQIGYIGGEAKRVAAAIAQSMRGSPESPRLLLGDQSTRLRRSSTDSRLGASRDCRGKALPVLFRGR